VIGVPATDEWLGYQVDLAVLVWGGYVENMLTERTPAGKPKYRIENLLRQPDKDGKKTEREYMDWRSIARFGG